MPRKSMKTDGKAENSGNSKNWNDLTVSCKQKIIEKLDFVDRVCMSMCSKSDKQVVEMTPLFIKELRLEKVTEHRYSVHIPGQFEVLADRPLPKKKQLRYRCIVFVQFIVYSRRLHCHKALTEYDFSSFLGKSMEDFLRCPKYTIGTLSIDMTFFAHYLVPTVPVLTPIDIVKITRPAPWNNELWDNCLRIFNLFTVCHKIRSIVANFDIVSDGIRDEEGLDGEDSYFVMEDEENRERDVFDEEWVENIEKFDIPAVTNIRASQLKMFGATKMEIWSHYLYTMHLVELMKRWMREDVPVGSYCKLVIKYPNLEDVMRRFELAEKIDEKSGRIPMNDETKEFYVYTEGAYRICCEVRRISEFD